MSTDKNLDDFLKNVDEIAHIIEGLNSTDESCRKNAFLKADKRLAVLKDEEDIEGTRTKENRTCINKSSCAKLHHPRVEMSQDNFLQELEQDAKQRAEKRKENQTLAKALKDLGNEAFAKGDYETAVQRYTEGLEKLRDMQVLYTNRAQAYIKLEKYHEAIEDCEWALKCHEKCIKAFVHMGRAYLGLKDYKKARIFYLKVTEIDPSQEKLVKGYLDKVDSQERKHNQEQKALRECEAGKESALTVAHLIQKLSREDNIPLYYSGGIKLLIEVVMDCTGQTLFRMNNGFDIIGNNKVINRSLHSALEDDIHKDLCLSVLTLWKTVCNGNEENQSFFISRPSVNKQILTMLSSKDPDVQRDTLALLSVYTMTERGRSLLLENTDAPRLLQILLEYVILLDVRANLAIDLLFNLTLEERLKVHFRANFSSALLPCITGVLNKVQLVGKELFLQCISVIGNLIEDQYIRKQMAGSLECWDSCLSVVDECSMHGEENRDILSAVLGLMLNMTLEQNGAIQERAMDITSRCIQLLCSKDGAFLTRSVGILSRVLPQCTAAVQHAVQGGVVKKLIKLLKAGGQRTSVYAVKALAVCAKEYAQARKDVFRYDKNFRTLLKLLSCEDEMIVGNAALCLGYCFEVPGAASSLLKSDVLKLLLTHAKEEGKTTKVQENAAIALGKLCTAESR
ncbi:tetratricopeptide repeat 12 isoform X1 [Pelobates cultripes]|nr:tetratricopeptide repeat 12 isoform X1 [Pelobates cultripes]